MALDWFAPLWVPRGKLSVLLNEVTHSTPKSAVERFDYHTSTLYTLAFQAVCIDQLLPQARSLKEFVPIAREAYLAFYSGYRASSIAALIPLIEGSLVRMVPDPSLTLPDRINRVVDSAIEHAAELHFEKMWAPRAYRTAEYLFGEDGLNTRSFVVPASTLVRLGSTDIATGEDERKQRVALLYSCATANAIYKQLACESDVILYRGAPYHQFQYAYGLDIHVGPVAGWRAPRALTTPRPGRDSWIRARNRMLTWFPRR